MIHRLMSFCFSIALKDGDHDGLKNAALLDRWTQPIPSHAENISNSPFESQDSEEMVLAEAVASMHSQAQARWCILQA